MAGPAIALRVIGYAWLVVSLIGAVIVGVGDSPLGGVAGGVAIALQGLLLGLIAVVIAEHGERVPE